MAKVQQVTLCPRCRNEIIVADDKCTWCGFRWMAGETEYKQPDYIYFQERSVKEPRDKWFQMAPHEAQLAAMEDAMNTLRHLLYSKTPVEQVRQLTAKGKLIGELAMAIEQYAHKGGYIETAKATKPRDSEEDTLKIQ